jgi:hypothetical protein
MYYVYQFNYIDATTGEYRRAMHWARNLATHETPVAEFSHYDDCIDYMEAWLNKND